MAELIVLAFDSEDGAREMRDKLLKVRSQRMLQLADAAVVIRRDDGRVKVKQLTELVGGSAVGGAFWGLFIGLLFTVPWLGLGLGAALISVLGVFSCRRVVSHPPVAVLREL